MLIMLFSGIWRSIYCPLVVSCACSSVGNESCGRWEFAKRSHKDGINGGENSKRSMTLCGLCLQRFKRKSLSHWQIKRLNWCIFVGTFSSSFKSFFFPRNNLVQSLSLRTDLYLQILTAKDNLSSTMGVISGGFVCEDSNFFFLRDKHKWITIMSRQIGKIRYFFYLRPCCTSPSSLVESQLAVLMHSWWLMTGVLSDHGILMATYP